jgi:hypothetical protein
MMVQDLLGRCFAGCTLPFNTEHLISQSGSTIAFYANLAGWTDKYDLLLLQAHAERQIVKFLEDSTLLYSSDSFAKKVNSVFDGEHGSKSYGYAKSLVIAWRRSKRRAIQEHFGNPTLQEVFEVSPYFGSRIALQLFLSKR